MSFPLPDVEWEPLAPFWAGALDGELRLPHCRGCGRIHWYPVGPCRRCGGADAPAWAAVAAGATLHSWTVVHRTFLPQFDELVPFVPALVALDVDPSVRLVTRLVDCLPDELVVDQPVEVTFRAMRFPDVDGEVTAPFYRPV